MSTRALIGVFVAALVACLSVSMAYTFLRDPVYRSTATLSIAPPQGVILDNSLESARYVSEQVQVIGSSGVLESAHSQLAIDFPSVLLSVDEFRQMASVEELPQGIVLLSTNGPQPEQVYAAARSWLDVYLRAQTSALASSDETVVADLSDEDQQLKALMMAKRRELDAFAQQHGIASDVRDENDVVNRTLGLNSSLNNAETQLAQARARLSALEGSGGPDLVLKDGPVARQLNSMSSRLSALTQELEALRSRFTEAYMQRDPGIVSKVNEAERLKGEINIYRLEAYQAALDQARGNVLEAESLQRELSQQLRDIERQSRDFKQHFERYQQMTRELQRLEALSHNAGDRLVQQTVGRNSTAPQVRVLDEPRLPEEPIAPNYGRDAILAAVLSLVLSGLIAWAYLSYQRRKIWMFPAATGERTVSGGYADAIADQRSEPPLPLQQKVAPQGLLTQDSPTDFPPLVLSPSEVAGVFAAGTAVAQSLIVALVSGVRPDELLSIKCWDVNLASSQINLTGRYQRVVAFDLQCADVMATQVAGRSGEQPLWSDGMGHSLQLEDLENQLHCAVIDSGLRFSQPVSLDTIQLAGLSYWVACGRKVSEVSALAGRLEKNQLDVLSQFAGGSASADGAPEFFPLLNA